MKINKINAWLKLNYSSQTKILESDETLWDCFYILLKPFRTHLVKVN